MPKMTIKTAALALAVPGLAFATPALAAPASHAAPTAHSAYASHAPSWSDVTVEHGKHRRGDRYRYDRNDRYDRDYGRYYDQPVHRNTRVWRGDDNRYYCRKDDGTTGLLIGGAVGALAGREIAGRGDRTLGAILGAAGGALLGREIDRRGDTCR